LIIRGRSGATIETFEPDEVTRRRQGRDRPLDQPVELSNPLGEPVHELETLIASAGSARRQRQLGELHHATSGQPFRAGDQPMTQRDRVQPVDHRGAESDQPQAMREQGAPGAGLGIGNPDEWEALVFGQIEEVQCVASVVLGLPDHHRTDLRVADQQRVPALPHQRMESESVPRALDCHRNGGDRVA
jgi:hypothetical protein